MCSVSRTKGVPRIWDFSVVRLGPIEDKLVTRISATLLFPPLCINPLFIELVQYAKPIQTRYP